jgi:ABC-type phosphate transport system substrate-binding protein
MRKELRMRNVQPLRRRITGRLPALWIAALLALACCSTALAAASASHSQLATKSKLAGKWKGHYSGAVSGHFTIHWRQTGSQLHGNITLSNPQGTYGISGSVRDGKIKFGAVSVGAKYKGKVRGTSMSGTWTSGRGGGSWSATKSS